jgi:hypothetical protein
MDAFASPEMKFHEALGSDVKPIWIGLPTKELFFFRPYDWFFVPFSLAWASFAGLTGFGSMSSGPLPFHIFGALFLAMGIYITIGRFIVDWYFRANTVYAVTADEVYIIRGGLGSKVVTLNATSLSPIEMQRKGDGSGTLRFGRPSWPYAYGGLPGYNGAQHAFEGIPDVQYVYNLVRAIR